MSLRVEGAHKTYRPRRGAEVLALDGVDVQVDANELLVVVGASGSGKSSLLRVIAGLEQLDAGRVVIDGEDVTPLAPGRRGVSLVFQEAALFPHLDVDANIGIGERARGTDRATVRARVREVAATLDVVHLLERMPSELSGGERQRVALARAIIRSPRVCLLDEPLASVDSELRLRMRGVIRDVQRMLGVPMVHVTHDQVEALALGDRVAVMDQGRVLQCDVPDVVYGRPATTVVARGVGPLPMNLLPEVGGVVVGVRPERVRLAPVGPSAPGGSIAPGPIGTVRTVEPVGEECLVAVEMANGGPQVLARLPWPTAPRVGDEVRADWPVGDEHHFDASTGLRR